MGLSYALFHDLLKGWLRPLLLLGLLMVALVDMYKYYTFRLLSENLVLFLVPLFLLQWKHWLNKARAAPVRSALCAVTLGLAVLTRPNLALFAVFMVVVAWWAVSARRNPFPEVVIFSIALLAAGSLLALRNLLVTGSLPVQPIGGTLHHYFTAMHPYSLLHDPIAFSAHYLKNIQFCCGFLNVIEPSYAIRPHWVLMAPGTMYYLWHQLRSPARMGGMDAAPVAFMLTCHVVLIAVAQLSNYGFRMLVSGLFISVGVSLKGNELAITAVRARRQLKARQAGRIR